MPENLYTTVLQWGFPAVVSCVCLLFPLSSYTQERESYLNWNLGPIEIEDQFPFEMLHLSLRPSSPEVLKEDSFRLRSNIIWTNSFVQKTGGYIVDSESAVLNLEAFFSPIRDLETGLSVPVVARGGGILDGFIDSFHETLGLPGGGRKGTLDDRYTVMGVNGDGSIFSLDDTGVELGDITLRSKYLITPGTVSAPAWSSVFELRLPTAGGRGFGQDLVDLSFGLLGSRRIKNWSFYWGGAYLLYLDTETSDLMYRRHHINGFTAVEYGISSGISLIGAFKAGSALVADIERFASHFLYLDAGAKIRLRNGISYELLVREGISDIKGTADVSLHFGISSTFNRK